MKSEALELYNKLSPEFKLLCKCATAKPVTQAAQAAIIALINWPVDWPRFLELVKYHQVYPLVYRALTEVPPEFVPVELMTELCRMNQESTAKSLQMTGELVRLVAGLETHGIKTVVLKGIPLAFMLYGSLALRPPGDIDILVRSEDVERAIAVLRGLDYELDDPSFSDPERRKRYMKIYCDFGYCHKDRGIRVELHWRLGHDDSELALPLSYIKNSLTEINLAGHTINVFKQEELLIFLALHGVKHGWHCLKWLLDIAALLGRSGLDWGRVYKIADSLEVRPLINQALLLANELLEAPLADDILGQARKDKKARQLAKAAMPIITTMVVDSSHLILKPRYYYGIFYRFSLLRGWKRKCSYIGNHFKPNENDIKLIALPKWLYFLYYLIRPFAWAKRRYSDIAGR